MPGRPRVDPDVALAQGIATVPNSLPAELPRVTAKATKWIASIKKIDLALVFWNLVLGFGPSMEGALAASRKRPCPIPAEELVPSSFFERFNDRLVGFVLRSDYASIARFR